MSDVPMDRPVIECRGLSKSFREGADAVDVLRGVSLSVARGETLAGIAYESYGDATVWRCIADANALDDPRKLRPGTRLLVPALPIL